MYIRGVALYGHMASSGLEHPSSCQKTSRSSRRGSVELATALFAESVLQTTGPSLKQSPGQCCPTTAKASRSSQSSGASSEWWGLVSPNAAWAVRFPYRSTFALASTKGWWTCFHVATEIRQPISAHFVHFHIYIYTLYCASYSSTCHPGRDHGVRTETQRKPVAEQDVSTGLLWCDPRPSHHILYTTSLGFIPAIHEILSDFGKTK